jgi:N-acetyl sugar amidotransferase
MKYCKSCLTPSTRPRVEFIGDICNACVAANEKKLSLIDYEFRKKQFLNLINEVKGNRGNLAYDCIVPWSGGKDSSAVALKLKLEHGLNPLLVTFNPLIQTEVGRHNRDQLINFGFDSIFIETNRKISSLLSRRFLMERGNPKLHWDAGINTAIFRIALQFGIKYIFYAEHGESTYGGKVLHEESARIRDHEEVMEHQIGDYPENWADGVEIKRDDLALYLMPEEAELETAGIEAHYYGYYFPWNVVDNYRYVKSLIDFRCHPLGRTCGTVTDYDSLDDYMDDIYYYLQYIKFGFGRAIRDLSRQIQFGEIQRDEAIKLAKMYDGEFPRESLSHVLKFLSMSHEEFEIIIDSHRSSSVWEKKNGIWHHKHESLLYL